MKTAARTAENEVSVAGNVIQQLVKRAALIVLIPTALVFLWLILVREPGLRNSARSLMASAMTEARADALALYANGLIARTEALANTLNSQTEQRQLNPAGSGFPDAISVAIIPLDDLGTAKLVPGDLGLTSHIDVDIVRRAFIGERPPPEIVNHNQGMYVLVSRPYGQPRAGVIMVKLDQQRITDLLALSSSGQYRMLQRSSGQETQAMLGDLAGLDIDASAPVAGTRWIVEFAAAPRWVTGLLPGWLELSLGALIIFIGLTGAIVTLSRGLPAALQRETDRILDAAELKSPLAIYIPELLTLATKIRQLSLLSRRQLVNRARRDTPVEPRAATSEATSAMALGEVVPTADVEEVAAEVLSNPDDGIPDSIFRETCIRGSTDDQLTDELVEKIARSLAVMANDRGIKTLLVGHDARPSSARIRTTLVKTLLAGGIDIIDLGRVASPLVHFAAFEGTCQSGVMITGGSGPSHDNGMKIFFSHVAFTGADYQNLLLGIREGLQVTGSGYATRQDPASDYIDRIVMDVSLALPLKVVVDFNFGLVNSLAETLLAALDCEIIAMNLADMSHRPPDWQQSVAMEQLGQRVQEQSADLGILISPDGDQLFTVTNTGEAVATDQLIMLLAKDILERNPGADVIYDIGSSRHLAPYITKLGGRALMVQSGDAFVYRKMLETNGSLGGEFDGHVFIGDRWYGFSDALYGCARLLELLAMASSSYADLVADLPHSIVTPMLRLPLEEGRATTLLNTLSNNGAEFSGARVTTLDGLRIDYADGWGLVRASDHEAALEFRFEGNDETSLNRVTGVLRRALADIGVDDLPF